MKLKRYVMSVLLSLLLAESASLSSAAFSDTRHSGGSPPYGGFSGPGVSPISVEQARVTFDDSRVIVRGRIVQHVNNDQYVFEDASSSVLVTLPSSVWDGHVITPQNIVELHGELVKTTSYVKIKVAKLVKLY